MDLADCASVADNIKRDIPGAKAAVWAATSSSVPPEKKHPVEFTEENRPDAVIDTFRSCWSCCRLWCKEKPSKFASY